MNIKIVKTGDDNHQETLEVFFNENEEAYIKGHSVADSAKIIEEFVTDHPGGRLLPDEPEQEKADTKDEEKTTITVTEPGEVTYGKDNWHGEKFSVGPHGSLRLTDDIDPEIEINAGGLLIYDGYNVNLSEQQMKNLTTSDENCTVAFDNCYFNEPLNIDCQEVCIDNGYFTDVNYGDEHEMICFTSKYATMNIGNGAHIDNLHIGVNHQVQTNYESADEPLVTIDHVDIEGNGGFIGCKILSMVVQPLARVEIYGKVNHMCVSGIAYIGKSAEVYEVHLHAGGIIYGHLDDIDITSDRPFRVFKDKNGTWIIG